MSTLTILPAPTKPISSSIYISQSPSKCFTKLTTHRNRKSYRIVKTATDDREMVTAKSSLKISKQEEEHGIGKEVEIENGLKLDGSEEIDRFVGKAINATIVLGFGTIAITKLLSIDHDYWHGWTLYEILRYAPEHNWIAYEEALKENPVLSKMAISGIVYSVGDWIAQCYEGKPLFEFDRARLFRSGLVGFALHGSLSHYYYQFCEALIPSKDWWVVPAKIAFDQTAWAALWNSIYFVALAFLRLESPTNILQELKSTFSPMLTDSFATSAFQSPWLLITAIGHWSMFGSCEILAGWKLWPFAHLVTYGLIPVEQRLLWVDCVELIWVTILSTYSNEKSEARITEATTDELPNLSSTNLSEDESNT